MSVDFCPICGEILEIIEYPVSGVMTQFWHCPECEYEMPVVVPSSAVQEEES